MRCQSFLFELHSPTVAQFDVVIVVWDDSQRRMLKLRALSSNASFRTIGIVAEVEFSLVANYVASDAFHAIVLQLEDAGLVFRRVAQNHFFTLEEFFFIQIDAVRFGRHGSNDEQQCAKKFSQHIN